MNRDDFIKNFWNSVAVDQIKKGDAPSVITDDMKKVLKGDKDAAKKIKEGIDDFEKLIGNE